ncbi:MAG: DUF6121 family protein [Microbacteriaceae bacterium]
MATVLYGALLFCADGFLSLWTNQDVIAEPGAGPLVGPAMLLVACALVFRSVWHFVRSRLRTSGGTGRLTVLTALAVWFLSTATGAVLYAFGRSDPFSAVFFLARHLTDPFGLAAAALALATMGTVVVAVHRPAGSSSGDEGDPAI